MTPGPWELLIILAIVLIIFGPRRLKSLGSDLGNAIKGFRSAMSEKDEAAKKADDAKVIPNDANASTQSTNQEAHKQDTNV